MLTVSCVWRAAAPCNVKSVRFPVHLGLDHATEYGTTDHNAVPTEPLKLRHHSAQAGSGKPMRGLWIWWAKSSEMLCAVTVRLYCTLFIIPGPCEYQ